jgi:HEAT repeat protein
MSISAAFHDAIQNALPHIIALLNDSYQDVQLAATDAIDRLAEHGR